jgi:protein phosphatase
MASLRTDQGQVHDHNEDFITWWEPQNRADEEAHGWIYIVADGVGGADAGEIASQYASERALAHYLENANETERGERLRRALQAANVDLRQKVIDEQENKRMATTMVTAVIGDRQAHLANVGDSRAYHWREGVIRQITKDQSLVAKLVEEGAISASEAENHPYQNVILYSIGSERNPRIDTFRVDLDEGDALILCSDGLTKHVNDAEIGDVVRRAAPADATQTLIDMANERGGKDNISVAVLRYGQAATEPETTSEKKTAVFPHAAPSAQAAAFGRRLLWLYTLLLAGVESVLLLFLWLFIRV